MLPFDSSLRSSRLVVVVSLSFAVLKAFPLEESNEVEGSGWAADQFRVFANDTNDVDRGKILV